ncbi:Sulfotransferase domain-containing protein [Thiohalospira halophila DSM 15071]|uniref:Sulfotransferase domain-containing protein n=1 Tax=Thiohalospira halophila DSM 15071 TaxID=1123397 RepID=A0A1I1NNY1_9GAMM|nr:sulfotransferase domain-containing protein [Thiohalospira halophila]SFC96473.1 Sulfotransferase domain-containing protein [Thiohalospira halophila DSM 15071]
MQATPILLIGAQKSGSSYLFRLIAQEPCIARAPLKEPKILSKPMHDGSDFLSHFSISPDDRFALDGSTSYLHVAGTAERAAAQLGTDIPVLVVLRDPAERAISGYLHEVKHGRELRAPDEVFDLPLDPAAAIAAEDEGIEAAWRRGLVQPHNTASERYRDPVFGFRYVANSWYRHQLAPWLAAFDDLRLVDFEELRSDPGGITAQVRAWLGLPAAATLSIIQGTNPTELHPWVALRENRALAHDHIRPGLLDVWRRQRALFRSLKAEKPRLQAELAEALRREFDILKQEEFARWL